MKKTAVAPVNPSKPADTAKSSRRMVPTDGAKAKARDGGNGNGHHDADGADGLMEAQELLEAMLAFRDGDFSVRLPSRWTGLYGKIADAFNDVLTMNDRRARETARVSRVVGREGKLKQRMTLAGLVGGWAGEVQALNTLMDD